MEKNKNKLKDYPGIAVTAIIFLYLLTESFSNLLVRIFFGETRDYDVLLKFILFSISAFWIVPSLLKLPAGRTSFSNFLKDIGLISPYPFQWIVIVTVSCYMIFIVFQTSGSLIYHSQVSQKFLLDFSRHSLFDSGSIIAGIFEEIILRGVVIAVLLNKFQKNKTMLLSSAIFSGLHLLNIFNPETAKVWVVCQVIWAFGLGLMYAFILIRMKALLPLIFLHYLINAFVGVWFRGLDTQSLTSGLYGILFFGILPAGLSVLWVYFLSSRWKSKSWQKITEAIR